LRFSVEWQDEAVNVAPEEQATVADLRLWVGQGNVCLHLRNEQPADHLTISLYSLASGLAHEWWTLFGGRDQELRLVKHRSGYAVPDIRMSYDGAVFEILAHQRVYTNPDVRFWSGPPDVMTRVEAEDKLSDFIETVLTRLNARKVTETSAALRWARVQASRQDADEATFCEAAGALGLDPYQVDDAAADMIGRAAGVFEGEPLTEFLAGARKADREKLLSWVESVEKRPRYKSRLKDLGPISAQAADMAPNRIGEMSWALGYRRARAVRKILGLGESHRFRGMKSLLEFLGASKNFEVAPAVDGIRLLRSDHEDGPHIHLRRHGVSSEARSSEIFTLARGIGDIVCFPEPQKAPVNDLHSAHRQATGRAFAAELLAPVSEVLAMIDDGRDVVSAADEFCVSTAVIKRQIENAERIRAACTAD
jgi:hypothetical protein